MLLGGMDNKPPSDEGGVSAQAETEGEMVAHCNSGLSPSHLR